MGEQVEYFLSWGCIWVFIGPVKTKQGSKIAQNSAFGKYRYNLLVQ
jgi:hypothetical protein